MGCVACKEEIGKFSGENYNWMIILSGLGGLGALYYLLKKK